MAQAVTLFVLHRTIKNQSDRADLDHARRLKIEHDDRLRVAYGNLIKAAEELDRGFRDLVVSPLGHAYPGTISAVEMHLEHNPFALVDDAMERARILANEAAAVILLDHADDPALRIYRDKVNYEFQDFKIDCVVYGPQHDASERLDKFVAAKREMEAAARARFPPSK